MAFQISSDVFIWLCCYKPSPSSPPQLPPPLMMTRWPPLTLPCQACLSAPLCLYPWLTVSLWVCVCVCARASSPVCQPVYLCVSVCVGALWRDDLWSQTCAPLEQKTCHISQSSTCFVAVMTSLSRLMKDKVLNCSSIRCRARWMTDTTLPTHVTERGLSALPIPSPICEHWCKR